MVALFLSATRFWYISPRSDFSHVGVYMWMMLCAWLTHVGVSTVRMLHCWLWYVDVIRSMVLRSWFSDFGVYTFATLRSWLSDVDVNRLMVLHFCWCYQVNDVTVCFFVDAKRLMMLRSCFPFPDVNALVMLCRFQWNSAKVGCTCSCSQSSCFFQKGRN